MENDIFAGLFSDSASSGKLFNVSITDYAPTLKKARVSVGNVPVGIYRQGTKDKRGRKPQAWHNPQTEPAIFEAFNQVKHKGNYYASVRNFFAKMVMNFGINDLFLCLTLNNQQKNLQFRRAPWSDGKCFFADCWNSQHLYKTVDPAVSSFLAEKRIASKKIGRELEE